VAIGSGNVHRAGGERNGGGWGNYGESLDLAARTASGARRSRNSPRCATEAT